MQDILNKTQSVIQGLTQNIETCLFTYHIKQISMKQIYIKLLFV